MPQVRVLVAQLPGMLSDIICKLLASEENIELVGEVTEAQELLGVMDRTGADVVILGLEDSELPARANQLLSEHPACRVLGVAGDGRAAFLYELRPYRVPLGEVSPEVLVKAIRQGTRHANGAWLPNPSREA